jgi:hypothetical protein
MEYMIDYDLTFFGIPLFNRSELRIDWEVPYITALLIDTTKFSLDKLDFTPAYRNNKAQFKNNNIDTIIGTRIYEYYEADNYETLSLCYVPICERCQELLGCKEFIREGTRIETFFWPDNRFFGFHIHMSKHRSEAGRTTDIEVQSIIEYLHKQSNLNHD